MDCTSANIRDHHRRADQTAAVLNDGLLMFPLRDYWAISGSDPERLGEVVTDDDLFAAAMACRAYR